MKKALGVVCICAALAAVLSSFAAAAETVLIKQKDGSEIEGEVKGEDAAAIEIQTKYGVIRVNRADILTMEKGVSNLTKYANARKKIRDNDAAGLIKLGEWCEKNGLDREAIAVYVDATGVAGKHYIPTKYRIAVLALKVGDLKLAVEQYLNLAKLPGQDKAWEELRKVEQRLLTERMALWKKGEEAGGKGQYARAVLFYLQTLYLTVRDNAVIDGDIGKNAIRSKILQARDTIYEQSKAKLKQGPLPDNDPGGICWQISSLPKNLRGRSTSVAMDDLRLDTERYVSRWLAVKGVFNGLSEWNSELATAIKLSAKPHPDIAVCGYNPATAAYHKKALENSKGGNVYLQELVDKYPYEKVDSVLKSLSPGAETVCYGRLRERRNLYPQYVFEVWAVEAVQDPEAAELAEKLKRPVGCEFANTPMTEALGLLEMLTQVKVEFEGGKAPDIELTLSLDKQPAGYAMGRIAKESGLEWTRKGNAVYMKKELTDTEKLLKQQVLDLATDSGAKD